MLQHEVCNVQRGNQGSRRYQCVECVQQSEGSLTVLNMATDVLRHEQRTSRNRGQNVTRQLGMR